MILLSTSTIGRSPPLSTRTRLGRSVDSINFRIDDCLIVFSSRSPRLQICPRPFFQQMTQKMSTIDNSHEDASPPTTPLPATPTINTHVVAEPPLEGSLSHSSTDPSTSGFFLPIPTSSANKSQSSFVYSDRSRSDSDSAIGPFTLEALSPEILNADLSLAGTCSFHIIASMCV